MLKLPVVAVLAVVGASGTCGSSSSQPSDASNANGGPQTPPSSEPGAPWEDVTPAGISLDPANPVVNGKENCGITSVEVSASDPATVYVATCFQGIWRSGDRAVTWEKVNTGRNGDAIDSGIVGAFVLDPVDPNVLYVNTLYGNALGIWKSTDGGVDWDQLFKDGDEVTTAATRDIFSIDMDPADHLHLIAASHGGWASAGGGSGVIETRDGGATWIVHPPTGNMGSEASAFFLGDGSTWIFMGNFPDVGTWRTGDSGSSFQRISGSYRFTGSQVYRSGSGPIYVTQDAGVLRTTDNGLTWTLVAPGNGLAGLVGDGGHIWATFSKGSTASGPFDPTMRAPESPGDTGWVTYGDQALPDGPAHLAADPQARILYGAVGNHGLYRMISQ
jgi:hypothetical protein